MQGELWSFTVTLGHSAHTYNTPINIIYEPGILEYEDGSVIIFTFSLLVSHANRIDCLAGWSKVPNND